MNSWKKIPLGKVTLFSSGGTPSKGNPDFWGGLVPWVSAKDLKKPIIDTSIDTLTERGKEFAKITSKGSILILVRGMTLFKDVPVALAGRELAFNQDIKALKISEDVIPEYLLYYLIHHKSSLMRLVNSAGHGTGRLDTDVLKEFPISIPSLSHQKNLASIFKLWYTAIEKTEALIDAKERQFRWLQNTLIRANADEWAAKLLNSLSRIKKGQQLNRDTLDDNGDYPVWNGGITPSGYTDKSNTVANTITISEGGNSCGFVNFCKEDFWLGGHCYAVEKLDTSLDPDFLFFCLKTNERRIMRLRVGSGLPNIQKKDIEKLQIQFPSIDEQKRISHTLNTAQQEITLLKKLADQYRTQKCGLMQKLLSGEWHIKNKQVNV